MNASDLLKAARHLSRDQRVQLVQALLDTLTEEEFEPLDDALRDELDRRLASHEADPENVLSWDQIRDQVRARP